MVEFWRLISEAIDDHGMSMQTAARKSGVSYYTIRRIYLGDLRTTSVHNAVALCRALEIPWERLSQIELEELERVRK